MRPSPSSVKRALARQVRPKLSPSPVELLAVALQCSVRQLVALRRDDIDGFLDGVEAHSEACARATALDPATLDAGAQRTFEQLHRVSSDLRDAIGAWQGTASARLVELRQARLATTAYSPLPPPPSVRSRGM